MSLFPPIRRFVARAAGIRSEAQAASLPGMQVPGACSEEPSQQPEAVAAATVDRTQDLVERRRFLRPIPVAQVQELDEEEAWALWAQHS